MKFPSKDPVIVFLSLTSVVLVIGGIALFQNKKHHQVQEAYHASMIATPRNRHNNTHSVSEQSSDHNKITLRLNTVSASSSAPRVIVDTITKERIESLRRYYRDVFVITFNGITSRYPESIPQKVGVYNGHDVYADFFCFEQCPLKGGFVEIVYKQEQNIVDESTCKQLQGKPLIDTVTNQTVACLVQ